MAFKMNKSHEQIVNEITNYHQYLKKDGDLTQFQTPEGFYLNITRIEQTKEEKEVSEKMEKFYNNYRDYLQEKKDE